MQENSVNLITFDLNKTNHRREMEGRSDATKPKNADEKEPTKRNRVGYHFSDTVQIMISDNLRR